MFMVPRCPVGGEPLPTERAILAGDTGTGHRYHAHGDEGYLIPDLLQKPALLKLERRLQKELSSLLAQEGARTCSCRSPQSA